MSAFSVRPYRGALRCAAILVLLSPSLTAQFGEQQIRISRVQSADLLRPDPNSARPDDTGSTQDRIRFFQRITAAARDPQSLRPPNDGRPRAAFETWADRWSTDIATNIDAGVRGIEWQEGKAIVHRYVHDRYRQFYISYVVEVEILPQGYRATFRDAAAPTEELGGSRAVSPVSYPAPQMLEDGGTVGIRLFADAETNNDLFDYVHIGTELRLREQGMRDVSTPEAEFMILMPQVRLNGTAMESIPSADPVQGTRLRISVPGAGQYQLSFTPQPGFEKAGEVAGNSLVFEAGGNVVRIDCSERIAVVGNRSYRLYARSEQDADSDGIASQNVRIWIEP